MLTTAQLLVLKADLAANTNTVLIGATPTPINTVPQNDDAAFAVADWYGLTANPAYVVWRTNVPVKDAKKATVWTEYIGRSQGERDAWVFMLNNGIIDASDANVRQGIQDIFSGPNGVGTRTALVEIAKRNANNSEKLFATGTGTTASPSTMGFEGRLSFSDIKAAWNTPA